MLTPDNKIMLIDFGIARHFKADDTSGVTSYVSFGFSPPEQYGRRKADIRSDIYALGVLLHYLLTGCDPRTSNGLIVPFEQVGVPVSENLKSMIMKATEPEADKRFQCIEDMVSAVRKKENALPINPSNRLKNFGRGLRKPYKNILAVALIVLLTFTGIALIKHFYDGFSHNNRALNSENVIVITNEQLSLLMSLVSEEDIDKLYGFDETDKEKLKEIAKMQGKGSTEGNIEILTNLENKYSDISEIYLLKGNNYLLSNEYINAIIEYEKALVIKSKTELAWNNKGLCELYIGEYEKALISLKEAISISDQHPDTWNNLAVCYSVFGNYEEALNSIDRAIELNPQISESYLNKSAYLYYLERYEESLDYTEKALKINPYSALALINKGSAYAIKGSALFFSGHYDKANEAFDYALSIDENNMTTLRDA